MPKTVTATEVNNRLTHLWAITNNRLAKLEEHSQKSASALAVLAERINKAIDQVMPVKGQPKGALIEIDIQTRRKLGADAQFLNLRSADELAQIVLHAYVQMREEEDPAIEFPLCLTTVKSA